MKMPVRYENRLLKVTDGVNFTHRREGMPSIYRGNMYFGKSRAYKRVRKAVAVWS